MIRQLPPTRFSKGGGDRSPIFSQIWGLITGEISFL